MSFFGNIYNVTRRKLELIEDLKNLNEEKLAKGTREILERHEDFEQAEIDNWTFAEIWFDERCAFSRLHNRTHPQFHWKLCVYSKDDTSLTNLEFEETLYLVKKRALEWTNVEEFALRVSSLERRARKGNPDDAGTFFALWKELQAPLDQNVLYHQINVETETPPGYALWLESICKPLSRDDIRKLYEYCIRPGELERQRRNDMGVSIKDHIYIKEFSRNANAEDIPKEGAFSAPQGSRVRNFAILLAFERFCMTRSINLKNSVILAQHFHSLYPKITPDLPIILQRLGRLDVLYNNVLYLTKTAELAIFLFISFHAKEGNEDFYRVWNKLFF